MPDSQELRTKRAVRAVLRRAFVGYIILFAGVLGMYVNGQSVSSSERDNIVKSGTVVAVEECNQRFTDRKALRQILKNGQRSIRRQYNAGVITTVEQRDNLLEFYDEQLKEIPLIDCRPALDILTADNKSNKIPRPLYPARDG